MKKISAYPLFAAFLLILATLAGTAPNARADWNVTVGGASANGAWSGANPDVWTPSATGATVSATEINTRLNVGTPVVITAVAGTGAEAGDIFVNSAVSWSANTLTFNAQNNINIKANLNSSGTASLVLQYGQGAVNAGNTSDYTLSNGAQVNLPAGANFSTKLGSNGAPTAYTVITALGGQASSGDGTLQGMVGGLGGNYVLGGNIAASGTSSWNGNAGFTPVGDSGSKFTGSFDGLGHTIDGLTIVQGYGNNFVGLFGFLNGARVQNLGLTGVNIEGGSAVGALAGGAAGSSTVRNIYATGSVTGHGSFGNFANVGGLLGVQAGGTLSNSYATTTVAGFFYVGGLVGGAGGTISNCYATGAVSGGNGDIGGLVGRTQPGGGVSNSYATGAVSASGTAAGGLVGRNVGGITISNSYATGTATATGGSAGGLVGDNGGTVTGSFWDTTTSATGTGIGAGTVCAGTGDCFGMTTAEMKVLTNFTSAAAANNNNPNWSTTTWLVYNTYARPLLRSFLTPLTVTANNAASTYNGVAYSGGNGVSYSVTPNANLLGTVSYSGTSQGAINPGSYVITPSGLYSNQQGYDITGYVNGTLTVSQVVQPYVPPPPPPAPPVCTLTASPGTVTAGGSATLTASCDPAVNYYGWVNTGFDASLASGNVSPATTTTYSVMGVNGGGRGNNASVTVTVMPNANPRTLSVGSSGGWVLDQQHSAGFISARGDAKSPPSLPPGTDFPQGLADFTLIAGVPGGTATLTFTYPEALPQNIVYWKYGSQTPGGVYSWYQFPNFTVSADRKQITLTITDGGLGDNDMLANGTIVDVGGPGFASNLGLWWNPNEPGWGMSVTQHGNMIFTGLYTYDDAGLPTWYVMSSCPVSASSCTGEIYRVTGGTSPTVIWNGSGKAVASAGTGTLTFVDADNGTFDYTLNGVHSSKSIIRQVFATGSAAPSADYSDLWWNASEPGWGVALTQQYAMIFAAWYTYDASGNAIWYVVSSCPVSGSGCTGDVYQVTGGSPLTSAWNGSNKVTTKVGAVTFAFTDANNGTMTYSINGVTGNRAITRQGF